MSLRLFVGTPLQAGMELDLLFDGRGGEWRGEIRRIGRQPGAVRVGAHDPVSRESALALTLAVGMPANERMDWLVEKATELGAAAIQPLLTERSVLRLAGERAERKRAHWQAVAVAAAEQSGRTRVPLVAPVLELGAWLDTVAAEGAGAAPGCVLSLAADARTEPACGPAEGGRLPPGPLRLLSGPEGGLSTDEEARARACGFVPWSLGPRVLRADTAPIAALARLLAWADAAADQARA